ncbi:hypothetical protein [Hymenobacter jeollabukensis]|uniref:Uncharacterized protein n=1 Tax=Hymenobacter jeollabukensis TaxID=2025313 RepID=A0A5R8WMV1_9BACT|nr:hypothetical protein [Hymenobacter jeollabukensis]TLM91019.1 hypothetical protein FDY95_15570 [Hymenobacter jeollabukensis]
MATYNQHPDEDRDYRGRNQNYSNQNRDWNNRFDESRRGQQRWHDEDSNTRGVSGNDGYSSGSSSSSSYGRDNDWQRDRSALSRSGMNPNNRNEQSWSRRSQDESRRYGSPSSMGRSSADYGSGSYDQQNQWNRSEADRNWQDHSARGSYGSTDYGASSLGYGTRNQGYGSSYGRQAYTSGSDPNAYGRSDRNGNWSSQQQAGRYEQDRDNRWSSHPSDRYDHGRSASSYSQGYYDADENSRYQHVRDHDDRHDRDEHRGFFGRMADRVSDWFSDDEERDTRRDWQDRDDRRYY